MWLLRRLIGVVGCLPSSRRGAPPCGCREGQLWPGLSFGALTNYWSPALTLANRQNTKPCSWLTQLLPESCLHAPSGLEDSDAPGAQQQEHDAAAFAATNEAMRRIVEEMAPDGEWG